MTIKPAGTVNIYGLFQIVLRRFLYQKVNSQLFIGEQLKKDPCH